MVARAASSPASSAASWAVSFWKFLSEISLKFDKVRRVSTRFDETDKCDTNSILRVDMRHLQNLLTGSLSRKRDPYSVPYPFFVSHMFGVEMAYVCLCVSWPLIPLGFLDLCAYLDPCVIDLAHHSKIAAPSNFWGAVFLIFAGRTFQRFFSRRHPHEFRLLLRSVEYETFLNQSLLEERRSIAAPYIRSIDICSCNISY